MNNGEGYFFSPPMTNDTRARLPVHGNLLKDQQFYIDIKCENQNIYFRVKYKDFEGESV